MSSEIPTIPEFYRDSKIFITGGTGFMGKVLVEKLLRSCPELSTIYLLLRPKKGKDASSRIADITGQALFDRLKQENPGALNKLVAVSGDVKELGLGLSEEDRRMLQDEVSVIFHSAASVRFDDPIRDAVLINVRGTREVVNLALGMTNLKVMLHVSTAYCNMNNMEVFERIYPAPGDWRTMITMVEQVEDDHLMRCLTPKITGELPNTYTYAKALSEHVINDHKDQLPLLIMRPSIVYPTTEEPMPGWIDNLNGPIGTGIGIGKGVIRTFYADPDNMTDNIPVDIAIKAMIYLAWHRALHSGPALPVFNSTSMMVPFTIGELVAAATALFQNHLPLDNAIWYPHLNVTGSLPMYLLLFFFFHLLPAILIDGLLMMKGKPPRLVKLQRKIFCVNMQLKVFSFVNLRFDNEKFLRASSDMLPSDVHDFNYNKPGEAFSSLLLNGCIGLRLHVLNESISSVPRNKRRMKKLYWLDVTVKAVFYMLLFWTLGICSKIRSALVMFNELPMYNAVVLDIKQITNAIR